MTSHMLALFSLLLNTVAQFAFVSLNRCHIQEGTHILTITLILSVIYINACDQTKLDMICCSPGQ